MKTSQGESVKCSLKKRHACCVNNGLWEKLNLRVDLEDQNSKIVLISLLNSLIEEQSAKLGSDAVVIDGKIVDKIKKKSTLITTNLLELSIYFTFTLLISFISACMCVLCY